MHVCVSVRACPCATALGLSHVPMLSVLLGTVSMTGVGLTVDILPMATFNPKVNFRK